MLQSENIIFSSEECLINNGDISRVSKAFAQTINSPKLPHISGGSQLKFPVRAIVTRKHGARMRDTVKGRSMGGTGSVPMVAAARFPPKNSAFTKWICTKRGRAALARVLWNLFGKLIRRRASNWYIVISRLFKQQVVAVIDKSFAWTWTQYNCFWSIIKAPKLHSSPLLHPSRAYHPGQHRHNR